jgi:hypothetical protein
LCENGERLKPGNTSKGSEWLLRVQGCESCRASSVNIFACRVRYVCSKTNNRLLLQKNEILFETHERHVCKNQMRVDSRCYGDKLKQRNRNKQKLFNDNSTTKPVSHRRYDWRHLGHGQSLSALVCFKMLRKLPLP